MAIDPRELERITQGGPSVIEGDRPCRKCGYNLRGLPTRGVCPECGTTVKVNRRATLFTDNLADAPLPYLRRLMAALWTMALSGIAGVAVISTMMYLPSREAAAVGVVIGVVWAIGVWVVTSPRGMAEHTIPDDVLDSPRLRWTLRGLHTLWPLSALVWLIGAWLMSWGRAGPWADVGRLMTSSGLIAGVVAVFGILPLGVYMSAFADWAGDSPLATRLRSAVWVMVAGVLFGLVSRLATMAALCLAGVLVIIAIFMGLMALGAAAVVIVSLVQLAYAASWAISNHCSAEEIARRRLREVEAHEAKLAQRSIAATPLPAAVPSPQSRAAPQSRPKPDAGAAAVRGPKPTSASTPQPPEKSVPHTPTPTRNPEPAWTDPGHIGGGVQPFFLKARDARVDPPSGEAGAEPYELAPDDEGPPKA